ncbi:hypothetical protein FHG87_024990, partial [Trinorchestia longiramus]
PATACHTATPATACHTATPATACHTGIFVTKWFQSKSRVQTPNLKSRLQILGPDSKSQVQTPNLKSRLQILASQRDVHVCPSTCSHTARHICTYLHTCTATCSHTARHKSDEREIKEEKARKGEREINKEKARKREREIKEEKRRKGKREIKEEKARKGEREIKEEKRRKGKWEIKEGGHARKSGEVVLNHCAGTRWCAVKAAQVCRGGWCAVEAAQVCRGGWCAVKAAQRIHCINSFKKRVAFFIALPAYPKGFQDHASIRFTLYGSIQHPQLQGTAHADAYYSSAAPSVRKYVLTL